MCDQCKKETEDLKKQIRELNHTLRNDMQRILGTLQLETCEMVKKQASLEKRIVTLETNADQDQHKPKQDTDQDGNWRNHKNPKPGDTQP